MRGNKVLKESQFHNEGTNYLFTALADVLCGKDRRADMPQYFDLGVTDSSNDYTPLISNRVYVTGKVVDNYQINSRQVTKIAAVFTAYIPTSSVLNTKDKVNTLALYSGYSISDNNDTRLAKISIPDNSTFELDDSIATSYIVEWAMTFDNVIETKEI